MSQETISTISVNNVIYMSNFKTFNPKIKGWGVKQLAADLENPMIGLSQGGKLALNDAMSIVNTKAEFDAECDNTWNIILADKQDMEDQA